MASFPSVRLEGGLLGPGLLDELVAGDLPGQRPADFGLDGRRGLTAELAAAFADARAYWIAFGRRLERLREGDPATTATRDAWVVPLLGLLGYELQPNRRAHEVDGLTFAISHRTGEDEDSPPVHIVGARQELGRLPPSGRPRLAPHSLVQEYLNRTEQVWGLATNGLVLRLLRNSSFVRRQAYVEFDLQRMLEEQRFADFAVLYRLLHRTRLRRGADRADECLLDRYHVHSREQGDRVREHLREGVEECIQQLANGFLGHSANDELRRRAAADAPQNERITAGDLYRQLLRLVYRLLFLLVSEDRGLLSPDPVYREHYGVARLRRLLARRAAYTTHDDLWQSLRVLWRVLSNDGLAEILRIAPLNGELFEELALDCFTIANGDFLEAFWNLAWYQEKAAPPRRVNYAALDVEELGSVYESLLDFHPTLDADGAGRPVFALVAGSERKTTGSYYTPPQLVAELIKSALEPVIADRLAAAPAGERERALLSIRVCDPACGSGHFLLAAARHIGKVLARERTGEQEPAPEREREAIRDVIAHCIYGVDKNLLAVDLCRVALWLESHTGGKPLTFLDHRIRCGDSLIGVFDLASLEDGIPDEAFRPLEGDDKTTARELKRRNRDEREGQRHLFDWRQEAVLADLTRASRALDDIADDTPESIRKKKQIFERSHADPVWRRQQEACDLWIAAFFQPLRPDAPAITTDVLADHLAGRPNLRLVATAWDLSLAHRFFHWPLEFPEVFADGGFDVVLSNPPWERVKLQEKEFFAVHDARIANARNKAARARLIRDLTETNPGLYAAFIAALRAASGASAFLRHGGRFALTGRGDINTYAVFAELARDVVRTSGRCGIIVQSDIATADTSKFFFQDVMDKNQIVSLHDFVNTEGIFPAVHRTHPHFCLLTMSQSPGRSATIFSFWNTNASHLRLEERRFTLTADDIALLNPNTHNCPIFRTQADAELTKAIYRRVPVLWREATEEAPEVNPWRLSFKRLFDMANDSHHFRAADDLVVDGYRLEGNVFVSPYDRYLPLYEAKMLHQFAHRWATYDDADGARDVTPDEKRDPFFVAWPRYWVREELVESAIPQYPEPVADALRTGDRDRIRHSLAIWAAGYHLNRGEAVKARKLLGTAEALGAGYIRTQATFDHGIKGMATALERDFPLSASDVQAINDKLEAPAGLARELVVRFSPKWLLGWRDITNSTNERTLIVGALPKAAVGHTLPLVFSAGIKAPLRLALLANLNSLVTDYIARQKVGGTHITYNLLKQFPVLSIDQWAVSPACSNIGTLAWVSSRVLELAYTAHDLAQLASDCDYDDSPFPWDEGRRFEIRCELDAAFFNLYLPAEPGGAWRPAEGETSNQLSGLKRHFPVPRDAVAYILDQFPIVRRKDEAAFGRYRTKDRILEIYDAVLAAQGSNQPYRSRLDPPPEMQAQS